MNSKTKNQDGVSDLNTDPKDPKSRLTYSDRENADDLSSVFTIEPDGDIPHIPPVKLRHNMEELTIEEEVIKKKLYNLNVCKSVGPDGVLGC